MSPSRNIVILSLAFGAALLSACGGLETEGNEAGRFTESQPSDGAVNVPVTSPQVLVFNESVKDESADAQPADGPCAEKPIRLSLDGFKTCVGGLATVVPDAEKHKISFQAAAALAATTRYEIKATKAVGFDHFLSLENDVIVSFTTGKLPPADGEDSPAADGDVP